MFSWLSRRRTSALSSEKLRVLDALRGYPPYTPPIWNSYAQSAESANEEYVRYFIDQRHPRLQALRRFLEKFDVAQGFTDQNIREVSTWLPTYADLLVDGLQHQESDALWRAYNWFEAPWTGSLLGLNVVFDIGIYMGECIIYRNPKLQWRPHVAPEPMSGASHFIDFPKRRRPFNPMKWSYTECKNIHSAKENRETWSEDSFYGNIVARAKD
ncbi:hypothetical protein ACQR0Z_05610 [Bradyrhizobium sp. HKCCYLS3077]|uniref:hypothetical protein n=1 Tax=Bradyrhizobium sp. HKCCYLS3077 TaxID=3420761 RepID=UPI003EB9ABBC